MSQSTTTPDAILAITWDNGSSQRYFNLRLKADRDALIKLMSWLTSQNISFAGSPFEPVTSQAH